MGLSDYSGLKLKLDGLKLNKWIVMDYWIVNGPNWSHWTSK